MKKTITLIFFFLFFVVFFLTLPKSTDAQGLVYCYVNSFNACSPDYLPGNDINEFVECGSGFEPPGSCIGDPQSCCTSQPPTSCNNVACVSSSPEPPPSLEACNSGDTCTGLDPGSCVAAGGYVRDCAEPEGISDCCQASLPPPPANCPSNYYCSFVGGQTTCENNGGIYQNCSAPEEPSGNCCQPSQGIYGCAWTGVNCYTDIAGSTIPYTCLSNYGHCTAGMPGCASCEEITTETACTGPNARVCVEQNPTTGYRCDSVAFGCQPCFAGSTDPGCNPPEYTDIGSCNLACSGQVPTRFRCDSGQCVEDGSGPYEGLGECALNCDAGGLSPALITCSGGAKGIDTAIGCIPLEDTNAFAGFFIGWGIRIAGGVAFLLIVFAGFQITTSGGDPKRLQAGRELLTAAIAGLLLLIFSVFILRLVGVNILGLPEFGG